MRMGVHTGEAEERDGGYFGRAVNRAARVADAGHGGQILVSAAAAALMAGVGLTDLGEHRLRDLATVEHLWQVGVERFPPVRSLSRFPDQYRRRRRLSAGRWSWSRSPHCWTGTGWSP